MQVLSTASLLITSLLLNNPTSFGQTAMISQGEKEQMQEEKPTDPYEPNAYKNQKTSPAYRYTTHTKTGSGGSTITTMQVNVNARGENIVGDAANEPSIAVNPLDPNNMVIGWRQFDNVNSNFRQAGNAYTTDGGQTWTLNGVIQPGVFRSDPVLECNASGRFFYNSLTYTDQYYCQVFISDDGGMTWDRGTEAAGGDKQWMVIDRSNSSGRGNIYAEWAYNLSSCAPGFFTRSTDGGQHYEECSVVDGQPRWGTLAVGNDGELYITGKSPNNVRLAVARSLTAKEKDSAISWSLVYVNMWGSLPAIPYSDQSVNPVGLLGQANIDVDRSNGPGRGNVYLLSSITRTASPDPCDIMFARSGDGGASWTSPVRVNDDLGNYNYQWFGTMSVAPNGRIDAIWLDTRDAPEGTWQSALYYSYSLDEGRSWSSNERLSELFDPHVGFPDQDKMGDYFDMESDSTGVRLAWANTLNGEQDVFYSYIIPGQSSAIINPAAFAKLMIYPNPVDQTLYIQGIRARTKIEILSLMGQRLQYLINQGFSCEIDMSIYPRGIYFIRIINAQGERVIEKVLKK